MTDDETTLPKGWTSEVLKNHYRYYGQLVASYRLERGRIKLVAFDGDELHRVKGRNLSEAFDKMEVLINQP